MIDDQLNDYVLQHSSAEPEVLHRIMRRTGQRLVNPRMLSGHLQGRLLSMISHMVHPRLVLELGTFAGYSALCLAEGLAEGGKVISIEKNDELEDFIHENLSLSPLGEQVEVHIGSTAEVLPTLQGPFDLVFMDADKRLYMQDYEMLFPLVRPGGFILADNTLWDGHIIDPEYQDAQTQGLRTFNDFIARDARVEKVLLPLRDGLTLIRKR